MNAIITTSDVNNEMDVILVHKHTMQLAEFAGMSLSDQTKLATAISELCRNCLEYAREGMVTLEVVERGGLHYLQCEVTDTGPGIPMATLKKLRAKVPATAVGRGNGMLHARKLVDYFDIKTSAAGTGIKIGLLISSRTVTLTAGKTAEWQYFFKNEPPLSPYEEIRQRNAQLVTLTEELRLKNHEIQTTLEKLKASEDSFNVVARNVPITIWKASETGGMEYVNENWLNFTGAPSHTFMQHGWLAFVHPDEVQAVQRAWTDAITGKQAFNSEFRLKDEKGNFYWQYMEADVVYENGHYTWVGNITNIDSHKQSSIHLEKIVNKSTRELQLANAELQRSNTDLEQFAYVASHDLKEPIRMISNFATLLSTRYAKNIDPEGLEFLSFITDGAERMKMLVSDLLNYSRIGRMDTDFREVDAGQVLEEVKLYLTEIIENSGTRIVTGVLPRVTVMGASLYQLFQNLIENAIKFARRGISPLIEIFATQESDHWKFMVRDNGIGMDEKFAEKIFIIFQRLHTRNEYPGTGIGLAICKKIVDLHGGHIWVESSSGQGSAFYFTLPENIRDQTLL